MAIAYFNKYPDVAAIYANRFNDPNLASIVNMTPEQFAQTHYQKFGANEKRLSPQVAQVAEAGAAASALFPGSSTASVANKTVTNTSTSTANLPAATTSVSAGTTVAPKTIVDYQGKSYDGNQILALSKQVTAAIDPNAIRGGVFGTQGESVGFNYDESTKLLGRAPTAAEQVVLDMSRYFINEGVTDLNNVDATTINRRFGSTYTGGGGTIYEIRKDAEGKPIISSWSKNTSDKKTILSGLALAALAFGIPGLSEGLLSGSTAGATLGTIGAEATGLSLAELGGAAGGAVVGTIGSTGLTLAELAQIDLALGGVGGTTGALALGESLSGLAVGSLSGAAAGTGLLSGGSTVAGMGTGTGITTAGAGGLGGATGVSGLGTGVGTGLTAAGVGGLGALGAGAGITTGAGLTGTGVLAGSGLGTTLLGTGTGSLTGTGVLTGSGLGTTLLGTGTGTGVTGGVNTGVTTGGLGTGALTTGVGTGVGTGLGGLTAAQLGALLSGGLTTAGGLLQQQTSAAAALKAQQMIDAETAAAKKAAQFRPIGMTTRFGASQFGFDPVTGQMTSAGYTLSPEAKAQQDRFVALSNAGLTQAEGAQAQFAPLQTGAQRLFGLGNQYLAETPQNVAQNYLNQQMALLQPGRELELATLQNKLQQQGRGGLSVAQGGAYGATTPELQALYNARAQQEAQLAAQAQQAGQQQVLYGAGLLGQGTTAMGNYYAGQQAAYAPYTTAMGQVTGLEALGQQPYTMSASLAQQAAQAGANVGQLGLRGAEQSVALATGKAATTNPYSTLLGGLGSSPALGTAAGNALYSLFS
jgi:hypothetical protein